MITIRACASPIVALLAIGTGSFGSGNGEGAVRGLAVDWRRVAQITTRQ